MSEKMSYERWAKIFAYLFALYPRDAKNMSSASGKAYWHTLKDIDGDTVEAAAQKLGAESKWFPAAAELRQAAFDIMDGGALPCALDGWNQLMKSFRVGYMEFDPLTLKTINSLGGRKALGMTKETDLPFLRSQFIKNFETYRQRELEDRRLLPSVRKYRELQSNEHKQIGDAIKRLADGKREAS